MGGIKAKIKAMEEIAKREREEVAKSTTRGGLGGAGNRTIGKVTGGGGGNKTETVTTGGSTTGGTTTGGTTTGGTTTGGETTGGTTGSTTSGPTTTTTPTPPTTWTAETIGKFKTDGTPGLDVLTALAGKDTTNGMTLLRSAGDWTRVVSTLPEGDAISEAGQIAMLKIVNDGGLTVPEAAALFKKRFKHELVAKDEVPATTTKAKVDKLEWKMDNVKRVWAQLDVLPENDVSKNTIIGAFRTTQGGGGMYYGGAGTIEIGETSDAKHMAHTVRHEVGHGVHEQLAGTINSWLKDDIGVWYGELDDSGIDDLVSKLGGWPTRFVHPDGRGIKFGDAAKDRVRNFLRKYTGSQSWNPGPVDSDPVVLACVRAMDPKFIDLVNESTSHWYANYANFAVGSGGNRFFLNHWYHKWFYMSPTAKAVVDATGENYTAMSEKEFFANTYAEFFADPEGKKDPAKWGGTKLPEPVKEFMKSCVLDRDPYTKYVADKKKKLTSG